jgi:hypothetical protein
LLLLGAVNKQVRKEARALFWNKLELRLTGVDSPQHEALHTFLTMLDPESRASIPVLRLQSLGGYDPDPTACTAFQEILPTLGLCQSLREIDLGLHVDNISRNDVDALKSYFSPGLERLANTIASLPVLTNIYLKFLSSGALYNGFDPATERFLYFAFSGMREVMLWVEVRERLQGNYIRGSDERRKFNGKTFVWIKHPHLAMFD